MDAKEGMPEVVPDKTLFDAEVAYANRLTWQSKLGRGAARALVYITGGFGGGRLLASINELEERERQNGTL